MAYHAQSSVRPKYAPIPQACEILGFKRSKLYELARQGNLRIIKIGSRSLVDIDHALKFMESLPEADLSESKQGQRAQGPQNPPVVSEARNASSK